VVIGANEVLGITKTSLLGKKLEHGVFARQVVGIRIENKCQSVR
jgi:hypothetical protein